MDNSWTSFERGPVVPVDEAGPATGHSEARPDLLAALLRPDVPQVVPQTVLLLQGPVGGFMARLQRELERRGHRVTRITFGPGDRLFGGFGCRERAGGGLDGWRDALARRLDRSPPDTIVLFGSARPVHRVARDLAKVRGIPVLSLEEGYLRPGFVTAEWGGNNADSPMAGRLPRSLKGVPPRGPARDFRGFRAQVWRAALYYAAQVLLERRDERALGHRKLDGLAECRRWVRNGWRRLTRAARDRALAAQMAGRRYAVVALQVPSDLSLREPACGWTVDMLVEAVIASFAGGASLETELVFKLHPLARGHDQSPERIRQAAVAAGVSHRVHVVEVGSLGRLVAGSIGLVTINSTSGFSAISHGKPLLHTGAALYAHPALARRAVTAQDFDAFWSGAPVASAALREGYLDWVVHSCLVPGDFYAPRGQSVAAAAIADKIERGLP